MYRLESDTRFTVDIDYKGDFVPSPAVITISDPNLTLHEVAELIFKVAKHPVTHEGQYIAGTAADAKHHRK